MNNSLIYHGKYDNRLSTLVINEIGHKSYPDRLYANYELRSITGNVTELSYYGQDRSKLFVRDLDNSLFRLYDVMDNNDLRYFSLNRLLPREKELYYNINGWGESVSLGEYAAVIVRSNGKLDVLNYSTKIVKSITINDVNYLEAATKQFNNNELVVSCTSANLYQKALIDLNTMSVVSEINAFYSYNYSIPSTLKLEHNLYCENFGDELRFFDFRRGLLVKSISLGKINNVMNHLSQDRLIFANYKDHKIYQIYDVVADKFRIMNISRITRKWRDLKFVGFADFCLFDL